MKKRFSFIVLVVVLVLSVAAGCVMLYGDYPSAVQAIAFPGGLGCLLAACAIVTYVVVHRQLTAKVAVFATVLLVPQIVVLVDLFECYPVGQSVGILLAEIIAAVSMIAISSEQYKTYEENE